MGLDLLAGTVRGAHPVAEGREGHIDIAFTVEAAFERGDPFEKQRLAVLCMGDGARQILHDILDQPAGSRTRDRNIA